MELSCPTCQRQLALAEPLASHLVQCPYCSTVMDVSSLMAAAAPAAPTSPASALTTAPQQSAAATLEFAPPTTVRTTSRPARRRKNNSGWGLLALSIVVGVAAVPVAMYLMRHNAEERAAEAKAARPSAVAYRHAQQFVRKLDPAAAGGQFPEDYEAKKQTDGRWTIAAHVDVPSQSGPSLRKPWTAVIAQHGNEWNLLRLEVAGEVLTSNEARRAPRVEFTPVGDAASDEEDNWFTGESGDTGTNYQFANEETVPWAVNLVGQEIVDAAAVRKTLVVWLFDKSASAAGHRADVLAGLSAIYREVEQSLSADARNARPEDKPLLSVVAAFGRDLEYVVEEPTDEVAKIESAVGSILEEGTGVEKTFAAIQVAVEKYLPLREKQDRYLMVVVVSDEAGDDEAAIQETLALLAKNAVPVSVVGARAPFGRVRLPGVGGPEMGTDVMNPDRGATLRQGPETPRSEHINLAFWNPSYGAEDTEFVDSGFGPYWLTRLAMESGGRYYACRGGFGGSSGAAFNPAAGMLHYFDPEVMKDYAPEYVSLERYAELLAENKSRDALVRAAELPRVEAMKFVRLDFPKFANEAEKATVLAEAQKAAAVVEPKVEEIYQVLKRGEADRPKLTGRRWQAAYDLAMGRALAAKVRTEGYNVMLAQLKAGTLVFSNPENDIFLLRPDDSIGAGSSYERLLKQSKMYLERVVAEHPGTPWAFLAERELQVPMGWKWVETHAGAKMDGIETP